MRAKVPSSPSRRHPRARANLRSNHWQVPASAQAAAEQCRASEDHFPLRCCTTVVGRLKRVVLWCTKGGLFFRKLSLGVGLRSHATYMFVKRKYAGGHPFLREAGSGRYMSRTPSHPAQPHVRAPPGHPHGGGLVRGLLRVCGVLLSAPGRRPGSRRWGCGGHSGALVLNQLCKIRACFCFEDTPAVFAMLRVLPMFIPNRQESPLREPTCHGRIRRGGSIRTTGSITPPPRQSPLSI